MHITFGDLLKKEASLVSILVRSLASIVYHSKSLISCMAENLGHDLTRLSILHNLEMLQHLQTIVSIEPTKGIIEKPTGIPPHVEMGNQLAKILKDLKELTQKVNDSNTILVGTIQNAIEDHQWQNGNVTST